MNTISDKWKHGAIPALLIHGCIGTVYCWSLLQGPISEKIGLDCSWAFSLAIFFLGISAAFFGPYVESNVSKTSLLSAILFSSGMCLSGVACWLGSIWLLYFGYGVVMGIGLGLGYLAPVKTLMLWFKDNKGLATGLAISGFGIAKVFAAPGFQYFIKNFGITEMFIFHGIFYLAVMLGAWRLLHKPPGTEEVKQSWPKSIKAWASEKLEILKLPNLWVYWLVFYLNITAGLAIISNEKQFFSASGYGAFIGICLSVCAIFNTAGRLGIAWWSDYFGNRGKFFGMILAISVISCAIGFWQGGFIPVAVLLCNAGYGAMFSIMPCALHDRYGMGRVSEIHGLILSAWAFAGLTGNQLAEFIMHIPDVAYRTVILACCLIYAVGLYFSTRLWGDKAD